jgi:hypothetical protein
MRPEAHLERVAALGIRLLPIAGIETHFVFERDGYAALVERTAEGFGGIGAAGLLTPRGLAPLVWRSAEPFFVLKDFTEPASPAQVDSLRRFSTDLAKALGP